MTPRRATVAALAALVAIGIACVVWLAWPEPRPPGPLARVVTLAGEGPRAVPSGLSDPFGVAVAADGAIFVADGTGGRVYRIGTDDAVAVVAEGLDMPSALAVLSDGTLAVANTGANSIVRVDPATGAVATIAAGDLDAPVGVAAAADGTVYVADTYNDRVVAVDAGGEQRTVAGGDGQLDTPCGVALAPDGALLVADTGNGRVVRLGADGSLETIAGADQLEEPTALAVRPDGAVYVADAGDSSVVLCEPGSPPRRFAGTRFGRADGDLAAARFGRPTGVALAPDGALVVADGTNGAVRAVVPVEYARGRVVSDPVARIGEAEMRAAIQPRWPYDPPDRPREVAATFGEARTENSDEGVWLHNALDVPGAYGETVRAMTSERVTRPLAARGAGERSEFLRLPLFAYVHVRVGRDQNDRPLEASPFEVVLDDEGAVSRVRVRRGARIEAGQPIGTLNKYNHVHLTMGPPGGEMNPLTVLAFPGFVDTVAPTIEAVTITSESREVLGEAKGAAAAPIAAAGRVRVLARAWDRHDANPEHRRLGLYRLGYQLIDASGAPAPGFAEPRVTISFERFPNEQGGGRFAYASGSRSWFTGPTVFVYEVTNVVRDGAAREELLDLTALAPGEYTLRVFAEDASANRASRDVRLAVR